MKISKILDLFSFIAYSINTKYLTGLYNGKRKYNNFNI